MKTNRKDQNSEISEETRRTDVTTDSSEASKIDGSKEGRRPKVRHAYRAKILEDEEAIIMAPPQPHEELDTSMGPSAQANAKNLKDAPLGVASPYHEEAKRPEGDELPYYGEKSVVVMAPPQPREEDDTRIAPSQANTKNLKDAPLELDSPYYDEANSHPASPNVKRGTALPYDDERSHRTKGASLKTGATIELAADYHDEMNRDTARMNSKAESKVEFAPTYHDERNHEAKQPNAKAAATVEYAPPYHDENDSGPDSPPELPVGAVRVRGVDWDGTQNDEVESFSGEVGNMRNNEDEEYLIEAHAVQDPVLVRAKADPWWRRHRWWIVLLVLIIVISIITAIVFATVDMNPADPPSAAPTTFQDGVETDITNLIAKNIPFASLPREAVDWVVNKRLIQSDSLYSDERALRQYGLLAFYLSISNGTIEILQNNGWVESGDECRWYGVTCDESNIVVSLEVNGTNLTGIIPPDIAILSNGLSSLNLKNNSLTGQLPLEFFELTKLSMLDLASNSLSGNIPHTIRFAKNLSTVDLSDNYFSSTVPTEIGSLTALKKLNLSNNKMIGSIPSEIGHLTSLQELQLQNNQYSSPLPTQMGNLVSLSELYLQNNLLLGPLPSEIGMMKNLRVLNMPKNNFFDKIPQAWWMEGSLPNLEYLDLSDNLLTGEGIDYDFYGFGTSWNKLKALYLRDNFYRGSELPQRISLDLPQLEVLDLSLNFFTGTIPSTLFDMTKLRSLDLWSNGMTFGERETFPWIVSRLGSFEVIDLSQCNLQGSIPTEIATLTQLKIISLQGNSLTGTIPTEIGALNQATVLAFGDNNFSGFIPTQIGNLNSLILLSLYRNGLSGSLPTELGNIESLKYLYISFTNIRGNIPSEIGNLIHLRHFDLWVNKLTGTIPSEIQKLEKLEMLNLDGNALTGTIPTTIGMFKHLTELVLSNNVLIGQIPTEIGLLSQLASLRISSNALTGQIPTELGVLSELEELKLFNTNLSGQIPTEIVLMENLEKIWLHQNELSGSIPITFCQGLPGNAIKVDCDSVICYCCGCKEYMMPSSSTSPSALPSISLSPSIKYPSVSPTILPTIFPSSSNEPSNVPSHLIFQNVTFNITLDKYPNETGWMIADQYNNVVHSVPPGSYAIELATVYESFELRLGLSYTFVLLDEWGDGLTGRVEISSDDSLAANNSITHLFSGESFSAFRIPFQVTEDGIIDQRTIITVKIKLDDYPFETAWKIVDSDGNVLHEVSIFTYSTENQSEIVFESVSLISGVNYTFQLTDLWHDGIVMGEVGIYLGESADALKGIEYSLFNISFSEYEIPFYIAEDGVIESTNWASSPVSLPVSVSEPPTAARECPPVLETGCSICGEGQCFLNPNEYIEFPGYEETMTCEQLELAASSGTFATAEEDGEDLCSSGVLALFVSACKCPGSDSQPPILNSCPEVLQDGCSLCSEGECVQNPDAIVTIPGYEETVTCGILESAAASGAFVEIGENACATVSLFAYACECAEPGLQPPTVLPPSPGPVIVQPPKSTPGCPTIVEGGCSPCGEGKCIKNINTYDGDHTISCGVMELGFAHGVITCSASYFEDTACECSEPELMESPSSAPPGGNCPTVLEGGCSICGAAKCVQNPATFIPAFDQTCGMLELHAAQGGFSTTSSCSILSLVASVCQCA